MKYRQGFVSNSSSSSFLLLVKPANELSLSQLADWVNQNKFEDHDLWALKTGSFCDGDSIRYKIDRPLLDLMLNHPGGDDNLTILVDPLWFDSDDYYCGSPGRPEITPDMVGRTWEILEIDYHGWEDLLDWKAYFHEITDEEVQKIRHEEWEAKRAARRNK